MPLWLSSSICSRHPIYSGEYLLQETGIANPFSTSRACDVPTVIPVRWIRLLRSQSTSDWWIGAKAGLELIVFDREMAGQGRRLDQRLERPSKTSPGGTARNPDCVGIIGVSIGAPERPSQEVWRECETGVPTRGFPGEPSNGVHECPPTARVIQAPYRHR